MSKLGITAGIGLGGGLALTITLVVFAVFGWAVQDMRHQSDRHEETQSVIDAAGRIQKTILDFETSTRAFMITREERFLEPWTRARGRMDDEVHDLRAAIRAQQEEAPEELEQAKRIHMRTLVYYLDHSRPLVLRVREGPLGHADRVAAVTEGKRRVDELRGLLGTLIAEETGEARSARARAEAAGRRALITGVVGAVLVSLVTVAILLFLARTVTGPVGRVAEAARRFSAGQLAEGSSLTAGLHAGHSHEIRTLATSFDHMARVVQDQQARLQRQNASLERRVQERTADLERARYEALLMLAVAAEYRDDDTYAHTQRVGRNAVLIAERLGLSEEAVALIGDAAPLHDIGKIGVSDTILRKPGRLTRDESEAMKQHVAIGESILGSSSFPLFHVAAEIAATHHERWDGSGYLKGLAGEAIPLAGRIVAVVDVFDALTSARPYKDPWTVEHAVDEIRLGAGTQFDPAVVEAFLSLDPEVLVSAPDAQSVEAA